MPYAGSPYTTVVTPKLRLTILYGIPYLIKLKFKTTESRLEACPRSNNNNNNKRPLTPKSMPPAGDEHAKLKT